MSLEIGMGLGINLGKRNPVNLGPELILDGDFSSATNWSLGTGWTISGGLLRATAGDNTVAIQNGPFVNGTLYRLTYTILNYSAGTVDVRVGGSAGTIRSANGNYVDELVAGANGACQIVKDVAFIGNFDNVSIREIL